jgi:hypothetical protein
MSQRRELLLSVVGKTVQYAHNGSHYDVTIPAKGATIPSAYVLNIVADDMIQLVTISSIVPPVELWIAIDHISTIYINI